MSKRTAERAPPALHGVGLVSNQDTMIQSHLDTTKINTATVIQAGFEMALMTMLANLEYLRYRMETASQKQQASRVLLRAEELLGMIVKFSDENMVQDSTMTLQEAVNTAARFYGNLVPVREQFKGWMLSKIFGSSESNLPTLTTQTRQEQFTRCLEALSDTVVNYFTAFTERFDSSLAARIWVESAAGFIADLNRVIRDTRVN